MMHPRFALLRVLKSEAEITVNLLISEACDLLTLIMR